MRFVADRVTFDWLLAPPGDPFDWDAGNESKSERKHGVPRVSVEALVRHRFAFAGRIAEPAHGEPRWLLLGEDDDGRKLALVFTRRGARLRPISCRPMRRKEEAIYESAEG